MSFEGITVDSNVMHQFSVALVHRDTIDDAPPHIQNANKIVMLIQEEYGFTVDSGGRIIKQWQDTCGTQTAFGEWLIQALASGIVKQVPCKANAHHKKYLRIKCGFPTDRFEYVYIMVALRTVQRYLVSEDIDFFDPKEKLAPPTRRLTIMRSGAGNVCRYLKMLGITVKTVEDALTEL